VHPTFPERALGALEDEVMGARGPLGRVDGALHILLKINMSSKKTRTQRRRNRPKMVLMSAWNVDGTLVRPNGITKN
jgi:hypothetical protein